MRLAGNHESAIAYAWKVFHGMVNPLPATVATVASGASVIFSASKRMHGPRQSANHRLMITVRYSLAGQQPIELDQPYLIPD